MIIRIATTKDVPQIVNIHMNAFEGFFLTTLGRSFLSFYYNAFVNRDLNVAYDYQIEK